ncbi:hypothetical protein T05_12021, partial [Trichinella murrelli]
LPNWLYPSSVGLSESVFLKVELDLDPLGNRCVNGHLKMSPWSTSNASTDPRGSVHTTV